MQKIIDIIDTFHDSDVSSFKNMLQNQLQQRFDFLVEHIPTIEKLEFSFNQIDEDCHVMTDYLLVKNNGYTYHYTFDYGNNTNEQISHWEFFKSQIAVIHAFISYVEKCSHIYCAIFGGGTLIFTAQLNGINS